MTRSARMSALPGLPREPGSLGGLPIFLDLTDQAALVLGGSAAAEAKAALLLRAGARVEICATALTANLQAWVEAGAARWRKSDLPPADLTDYRIVIGASETDGLNARLAERARNQRVLVNCVDQPERCDFTTPAIVDRAPLVVAISTKGASPVLARMVREKLERWLPEGMGRLARAAGAFRGRVAEALAPERRRRFWENLFAEEALSLAVNASDEEIEDRLEQRLSEDAAPEGSVSLIGAGPGDPNLLTLAALRSLERADVVLYDELVSGAILDHCRRDARTIAVGRRCGAHRMTQDQVNELMVRLARDGLQVVRLKGGDPFVFGRVGEEAAYLTKRGVRVATVPGVTAASAAASILGAPLTHRGVARELRLVTVRLKDGSFAGHDWSTLADPSITTAYYMGGRKLAEVADHLLAEGMPADCPVGLVESAGTEAQEVRRCTIGTLGDAAGTLPRSGPVMLLTGMALGEAWGADRAAAQAVGFSAQSA
ncbi:MAG: siroheme synthase CysG [Magnetovibrionaceae bacterium]